MILFIFEGKKQEPRIYKTIKYLFFNDINEEEILHYYCGNIYTLYKLIKNYSDLDDDVDIVRILQEKARKENNTNTDLNKIKYSYEVSEIYLFFDYDLKKIDGKNKLTIEEQNKQIQELVEYFDDESKGKLYIDYPMIESFRYFKNKLPDENFKDYTVDCLIDGEFKQKASEDSYYKNLDKLCFPLNSKTGEIKLPNKINGIDEDKISIVKENWLYIREANIKKANFICDGNFSYPSKKDDISQKRIFYNQLSKYVELKHEIAILNSFPLFWYEYVDISKI